MGTTAEDLRRRLQQDAGSSADVLRGRLGIQPRSPAAELATTRLGGARPQPGGDPLELSRQPSGLEAFTRGAGEMFLDNLMQFGRGVSRLAIPGQTFTQGRSLPLPSGQEVMAGIEAIPRALDGGQAPPVQRGPGAAGAPVVGASRLRAGFEEATQARDTALEAQPEAFATGQIGGDIASLIGLRMPFARGLAQRSVGKVSERQVADTLEAIGRSNPDLVPRVAELIGSGRLATPGAQRLWQRALESNAARSVASGLGKAAETGLEGAVLATLKSNDPLQIGALSAGGQLAASALGTAFGVPSSLKGLAIRAGSYLALFRLGQEFLPVDKNVYQAMDTSFDKLQLALTVGLASQFVGGRFRGSRAAGRFAEDLPKISDAINTIPRGALLSFASRVDAESARGETTSLAVLERVSSNPEFFGRGTAQRLDRALKKGTWNEELDRLMKIRSFRNRLDELELE